MNYLHWKIAGVFGNTDAIVTIHGGTNRDKRRTIQEKFRSDPVVRILVATDAAGEGVNLQNANLMVNYDLPWNPNRLEQRFGRIHRIGQQDGETAAGKLLGKIKEKSEATRQLAYRLYTLCERQGWAEDARAYNELITSWPGIEISIGEEKILQSQTTLEI